MRVLLDVSAIPARPVGAGVYVVNLAGALNEAAELDLALLARKDDTERWRDLAPRAQVLAIAPLRRPARLAWEQTSAPRVASRFDAWHGPHYTLPLRAPIPTVVTVHDMTFFDRPEVHERAKVLYFRRMIAAAVARAAVVVAVSEHTAAGLRKRFPSIRNLMAIPHGVDHHRFRPDGNEGDDLELLRAHGIRPPYVGYLGTIEPRKNLPNLVRAFSEVARDRPELRLVLAGRDGWGAPDVRHAIEASGVATRVMRPGYLPDAVIPAFLRRAAAVAYPSFEEGFGLPVLEAMACGAPVVTSTNSATAEVADDAALLVDPTDTAALAVALSKLLDDPSTSSRLRARGVDRAREYTWAASADAHVAAYKLAMEASR
ncbi:MAG: glycosyltransferase family 4 protein [Acidimicrobiia bacterium]